MRVRENRSYLHITRTWSTSETKNCVSVEISRRCSFPKRAKMSILIVFGGFVLFSTFISPVRAPATRQPQPAQRYRQRVGHIVRLRQARQVQRRRDGPLHLGLAGPPAARQQLLHLRGR